MRSTRSLLVVALLVMLVILPVFPSSASAQDETPEPGATAAQSLPSASVFGADWTQSEPVSPDILARYSFEMSPDVFQEGAAATYLGPSGSRAVVVNLILTDNRVAVRRSWEDASELLRYLNIYMTEDYQRTAELETMSAPDGCAEAKRVEGIQQGYMTPVGGTMCAIDPDGILIVVVDGTVNELTGVAASDSVVTSIVAA